MRAVVQRVRTAKVEIAGKECANIGKGFLILLGVIENDTEDEAKLLASKIANLRIFKDENDKMNLSLLDINGSAIVVSQFTLAADCRHGRRPSFISSAKPDEANALYEIFKRELNNNGIKDVQSGEFGADMLVSLQNDGPVTITLDTDDLQRKVN